MEKKKKKKNTTDPAEQKNTHDDAAKQEKSASKSTLEESPNENKPQEPAGPKKPKESSKVTAFVPDAEHRAKLQEIAERLGLDATQLLRDASFAMVDGPDGKHITLDWPVELEGLEEE